MSGNPSARRYVPSEIWGSTCDLRHLECYITGAIFVLGRCDACGICTSGCRPRAQIELRPCEEADICDCKDTRSAHGQSWIIAVDGACRGNGLTNAEATYGIFCNVGSPYNRAIKLQDARPTSQRAELHAAIMALKLVIDHLAVSPMSSRSAVENVVIKTDSAYLANSMVTYVAKWRVNDYTNHRGSPVHNQDLFRELDNICNDLALSGVQVRFWQVPRGQNMPADRLANAALDGSDWRTFSEDDLFEGGEKPHIHHEGFSLPPGTLFLSSAMYFS
jgi:ribonuclease HI